MEELKHETAMQQTSIRRDGGGRKSAFEHIPELDAVFLRVLAQYTAGSPMDETVKWTNLNRREIAELMTSEGVSVNVTVVDQLID
jgi:hypothetical protein